MLTHRYFIRVHMAIMLSVVDEEAKIRAYLPLLEALVQEGLVVLSDADVIKYTHRLTAASARKASTATVSRPLDLYASRASAKVPRVSAGAPPIR